MEAYQFSGAIGRKSKVPFRVAPEKTVIPDAPGGALHRDALLDRCDPVRRRLTVVISPGGFGKTTLLAECCRRSEARGDKVIWLSADEQDDAQRVVAHLIYAADIEWEDLGTSEPGASQSAESHYLDALMAEVRADGGRWVLAVDELDRLPDGGARVVDHLIWRGPANLHLALAGRGLPRSIDVATPVAEGRGLVLGSEELRFTRAEFGHYFGGALAGDRVRELWTESQGWPIAACLQRNLTEAGETDVSELALNWVAARLLRGVGERDRRFVLEAGCFEWADAQMFDEVLGAGAAERLRRLPVLRGLVTGIDGGAAFRLHPLVRAHAENELRSRGEAGGLRRRIARALAARGRTVEAMGQALEADDGALAAEIFEHAGAVRLVLVSGVRALQDAVALLPADATPGARPRLDLARLAASSTTSPAGLPFDPSLLTHILGNNDGPDGGEDDLRTDGLIAGGVLLICGCAPVSSPFVQAAIQVTEQFMARTGLDPVVEGGLLYGQAVYRYQAGDLDRALAATRRVRAVGGACPAVALNARNLEGGILFAQGAAEESETVLAQAKRTAHRNFAGHANPVLSGEAFAAEAALEAGRLPPAGRRAPTLAQLADVGAWMDVYAAALDVRVELALREDAPNRALHILEEASAFARARRLQSLIQWVSAARVATLARVGRVDEAHALWREEGPPDDAAGGGAEPQAWREMEAVCTARMRLLFAEGDYAAALDLGRAFAARAREHGLRRSESWATALCMQAAWLAGDAAAAQGFLVENLRLFQRTGFSRALATQGDVALAVLRNLDVEDRELNAAKAAVLELVEAGSGRGRDVALSPRQAEVLCRLGVSDKEIARALGLTDNGVRYHVKKIMRKLAVSNRREAMREARRLGLLPPPEHDGRT